MLKVAAIKAPTFGERKNHYLEDISILTGGIVIREDMGFTIEKASMDVLGFAAKVVIKKYYTLLVTNGSTREAIENRVNQIKSLIENTIKQKSSSIYIFPLVPSLPLKQSGLQSPLSLPKKPLDRRVVTDIDQPSEYVNLQKFPLLRYWSSSTTIKVKAKMIGLEIIQHATTFLQWHKGKCYIFQRKPSFHFTQWDPGGWSHVHRRSQHAWKALYLNENSGSSSSKVKETDVGRFP
jgi:hypothetical protein